MRRFTGFTLVELLIVIAVLAIMLALLVSAVRTAKEKGRRVMCMSNLRQLGVGMHMYADSNNSVLPDYPDGAGSPDAVTGRFRDAAPGYGMSRSIFYCPSRFDVVNGMTAYGLDLWDTGGGEAYPSYMNVMNVDWSGNKPGNYDNIIENLPSEKTGDLVLFGDITLWHRPSDTYVVNHARPIGTDGGRYVRVRSPDGANLLRPDGHDAWRRWEDATYKYRVPWVPGKEIWW